MNGTAESVSPEDDFLIIKASEEDAHDIHQFLLGDFLTQEPLNVSLGVTAEESTAFFEGI